MKRTDTDKGNPHAISSNYIARWVDRNVEQSSVIMVDRKIVTDCRIQSSRKNDRRDIIEYARPSGRLGIGLAGKEHRGVMQPCRHLFVRPVFFHYRPAPPSDQDRGFEFPLRGIMAVAG